MTLRGRKSQYRASEGNKITYIQTYRTYNLNSYWYGQVTPELLSPFLHQHKTVNIMALCRNIAVGIYTLKATVTNDQHYHNTTESTVAVLQGVKR